MAAVMLKGRKSITSAVLRRSSVVGRREYMQVGILRVSLAHSLRFRFLEVPEHLTRTLSQASNQCLLGTYRSY